MNAIRERYVATSARGEWVVRTDSPEEAARWALKLGGRVVDRATRPNVDPT
uniref:DUF2188 domain-containing protein n=1 Tax=Micrococcus phage Olihed TaxID=3092209 RepID=A0AAU6R574_9CAUD